MWTRSGEERRRNRQHCLLTGLIALVKGRQMNVLNRIKQAMHNHTVSVPMPMKKCQKTILNWKMLNILFSQEKLYASLHIITEAPAMKLQVTQQTDAVHVWCAAFFLLAFC